MNLQTPPAVSPLDETRLVARQAHLASELARGAAPARRRRGLVRGGILAVAGLAAVAVLLTGRGGGPDVEAKALAAVSRGPYLGIVERPDHVGLLTFVHLRTHTSERVYTQYETWFDTRKHGRAATVGACVRWIGPTAHTACSFEYFSDADPLAITGSIDRYRAALASGRVTRAGTGTVRGRHASWLRIAPAKNRPRYDHSVVYVAVDEKTGNPLRIETRAGKHVYGSTIDVIPESAKLPGYIVPSRQFGRLPVPPLRPGQRHGRGGHPVTLAQAGHLIPGALWAGSRVAGLPFRRARVIALDDGKKQLELVYGGGCPAHCVLIKQGVEAGWAPGSQIYRALPDETVFVSGGRYANGRAGSIVFRLEGTGRAAILAIALALRPLAP
jgi:hypothetical protein